MLIAQEDRTKDIKVNILKPGENDFFVNSNLDYSPIACKVRGELGEGVTPAIRRHGHAFRSGG